MLCHVIQHRSEQLREAQLRWAQRLIEAAEHFPPWLQTSWLRNRIDDLGIRVGLLKRDDASGEVIHRDGSRHALDRGDEKLVTPRFLSSEDGTDVVSKGLSGSKVRADSAISGSGHGGDGHRDVFGSIFRDVPCDSEVPGLGSTGTMALDASALANAHTGEHESPKLESLQSTLEAAYLLLAAEARTEASGSRPGGQQLSGSSSRTGANARPSPEASTEAADSKSVPLLENAHPV